MLVGDGGKPLLIAGPCVIESESLTLSIAEAIAKLPITREFHFVFKASFTKDNRSAGDSFRGPGRDEGLRVLEKVRDTVGCPILSDVHSEDDVRAVAPVLDV
ncbi:MAG TPA: 3-deoxy-8-phosphooctulonate synthase, partial [Candidatus Krumholzibacteria bacterium]|nr:3-deoxy-8-phosphooctulonate synthase [Candidatus Krumholzibacteria bacterium]